MTTKKSMLPLYVTLDEAELLRGYVASHAPLGDVLDLLKKVEKVCGSLKSYADPNPREVKYRHADHERRLAIMILVSNYWPPGYHSIREVVDGIMAYVDQLHPLPDEPHDAEASR